MVGKACVRLSLGLYFHTTSYSVELVLLSCFSVWLAAPGSALYVCRVCQRVYSHKKTLARHQQYECQQDPRFQCPLCGKKCKLKSNLKQHFVSVHAEHGNDVDVIFNTLV